MEKVVLKRENRVNFELNTMYFGLYCYWMLHNNEEKAVDAIKELHKVIYPGTFGYLRSIPVAKKFGIMK